MMTSSLFSHSPVRVPADQQPSQRVPGVRLRVRLQEMVLAAVARELQFGADLMLRKRERRGG